MFSGIVAATGRVSAIRKKDGFMQAVIGVSSNIPKAETGMSIAINGVCLTAVQIANAREFTADISGETAKLTTLSSLHAGVMVNVEYPVTPDTFLSGHIMQGHVDTIGTVLSLEKQQGNTVLTVKYDDKFDCYMIEKGSIAVDGTSLTAFNLKPGTFSVSVIPETLKRTIMNTYKKGTEVNLEFDVIGKYAEKFLRLKGGAK